MKEVHPKIKEVQYKLADHHGGGLFLTYLRDEAMIGHNITTHNMASHSSIFTSITSYYARDLRSDMS